jgi:hypothetical protein
MSPNTNGDPPMVRRKSGRIAVAVSWLRSLRRLARPMARTPRENHLLAGRAPLAIRASPSAMSQS